MVDRKRIELFPKACKAPVLPLSLTAHLKILHQYIGVCQTKRQIRLQLTYKVVARTGFEPIQRESKSLVLPLHHRAIKNIYLLRRLA